MNRKLKSIVTILMCVTMCFVFAACGSDSEEVAEQPQTTEAAATIDPEGTDLTVKGDDFEKTYTADDLTALGTETIRYSGRNKKVENARVFQEKTGVDLKTVLADAGLPESKMDKAVLKVTASDEYVNEYELAELYEGKIAFADNDSDKGKEVGAMIAICDEEGDYPSPFQIVFGQADYDKFDNSAQDFNVQNWGSYIQIIEVSIDE